MSALAQRAKFLVYALLTTTSVFGELVNVTLDDAFEGFDPFGASISYSGLVGKGDNHWHANSAAHPCQGCDIQPDPTKVGNGTWHDGSVDGLTNTSSPTLEMTITFNGVAVYVYGVVYHPPSTVLQTYVQFQLNNDSVETLSLPNGDRKATSYLYNQTFFSREGLTDGPHVLIATIPAQKDIAAEMVFDYVVYTRNEDNPTSSSTPPAESSAATDEPKKQQTSNGAIVGGVVGGCIAAIGLLALLVYFLRRRNLKRGGSESIDLLQDPPVAFRDEPHEAPLTFTPQPFQYQPEHHPSELSIPPDRSLNPRSSTSMITPVSNSTNPPSTSEGIGANAGSTSPVESNNTPSHQAISPEASQMLMQEVAMLRAEVQALRTEPPPQYGYTEGFE